MSSIASKINDVSHTRAIDVSQSNPLLVKLVVKIKHWRVIHSYFGSKATMAKVWPVAYLAIANARKISKAVSRHIGQVDRLSFICKYQARPLFFIKSLMH